MTHLSALYCYPVKSCRGVALDETLLDARGIVHDRAFMVVDADNRFLTQRATPALGRVITALTPDALHLQADGAGEICVPWHIPGRAHRPVVVWDDTVLADDAGDEAAGWFSDVLGQSCRLVTMGDASRRDMPDRRIPAAYRAARTPLATVAFCDAYPLLVLSEESLADLNRRVGGDPVLGMDRFRPNVVLSGCPSPYAEDEWKTYRVGKVRLFSAGPCKRCPVPTIDPQTLERGPEPLRTLAAYRRFDGGVIFGQNVIHAQPGERLRVGSEVTLET